MLEEEAVQVVLEKASLGRCIQNRRKPAMGHTKQSERSHILCILNLLEEKLKFRCRERQQAASQNGLLPQILQRFELVQKIWDWLNELLFANFRLVRGHKVSPHSKVTKER